MKNRLCLLLVLALDLAPLAHAASATAGPKSTRIDARMMRQPAVSATQIAFVYAGDIWVADKTRRRGGAAQFAAGRGVVPALLAGRLAAGLHAAITTATRTFT